ncbi:hypothetical protein FJZ36_01875 [Candidatus Poribacteria bacterium]|nr:hypothetical protein [Candidatus Poribacteria bacterium]
MTNRLLRRAAAATLAGFLGLVTSVAMGQPERLPGVFDLDEVVVVGKREPEAIAKQTLIGDELRRVPGTAGDALRAIEVLPSVSTVNDLNGALFIRGGGPLDNDFYFDRMVLGYPYHFGGLASTLSTDLIGKVDVLPGGFGAQYGDAQAIVDIRSREARRETDVSLNVNALLSESTIRAPLGDKGSVYAAGRRTYADLVVPKIVELDRISAFPRFWDYQVGAEYDLDPSNHLRIGAFASDDYMRLLIKEEDVTDDPELAGDVLFATAFRGQGATLESRLGKRGSAWTTLSRLVYRTKVAFGRDYFLNIDSVLWALREDAQLRVGRRNTLEVGGDVLTSPFTLTANFLRPPSDEDADQEFDLDDLDTVRSDTGGRYNWANAYVQDRFDISESLSVTAGVRASYFSETDDVRVDPRASLAWATPTGAAIRAAWGRYTQNPEPFQIDSDWGNPDVSAFYAYHYVLEGERNVSEDTFLKVSGYYKDYHDLVTDDAELVYKNQGTGFARGFELLARYSPSSRLVGWASYALSDSRRRYRPGDPELIYSYDQTHVGTLTLSFAPNPKWELGAKWQYATGTPYTPILGGEPVIAGDGAFVRYRPIYGEPYSVRYPPFHRLDLRLARGFRLAGVDAQFYMEVLNAYARMNVFDAQYNRDFSERDWIYQLPLVPFIGLNARF